MEDKITLDRETFKALAVDTRVRILKILDERQHTLSDLAEELDMAPSTIKEHLETLVSAGLIKQMDKGMKWKYYRLTPKGRQIINPHEKKVLIVLAASLLTLAASLNMMLGKFKALTWSMPVPTSPAPEQKALLAERSVEDYAAAGAGNASDSVESVANTLPHALEMPYVEIGLALLSALILGACIGFLLKRKKMI
ncbi:MAG: winged helix-turn-helix transcriptional regulator [Candidatus Altiarchaeota archaeon]|nr:winged helix-turn-helix transcriptional regulator [Candidatus Altiarchaeota archaeon]